MAVRRGSPYLSRMSVSSCDDDFAEAGGGAEDALVLGDVFADLGEFAEELVDGELGEAVELELEDGVDLAEREDEGGAGGGGGGAREVRGRCRTWRVERDAGELGAAERDGAAGEEGEEVFAGVGAGGGLADDADDLSRWSRAIW